MAKSKVMHGARAVVWVGSTPAGIFNNVSVQVGLDVAPAYILGRFSPAELVYVGAEVVNLSMTGFRVMKNGPFSLADVESGSRLVPFLQDLMTYDDISVSLHDRSEADPTASTIMQVFYVKPTGFSESVGARGLMELTVNMQGLTFGDEEGDSAESKGAADLPAAPINS
jgi:hypothetical protein